MRTCLLLFALATLFIGALASSHSEAPGTAQTPSADITDFYMFQSYESGRSAYTTFLLNIYPLQNPFGGPNYFSFSDEHFYEINIDNNGDAKQDFIFQFIYGNRLGGDSQVVFSDPDAGDNCNAAMPYNHTEHLGLSLNISGNLIPVALKFIGPITFTDQSRMNWFEYYQVQLITGDRNSTNVQLANISGTTNSYINKPFDYAGTKTFGNSTQYESYARSFITNIDIPGCSTPGKVWAGQRKESFHINLGRIFDLVNLVPLTGGVAECDATNNVLNDVNIGTFALEIPTSCLKGTTTDVISGWATVRTLDHTPMDVSNGHAPGKQTSRLGNPLVNELIIGLPDKDDWSTMDPIQDAAFLQYVEYPTLPAILDLLFRTPLNFSSNIAPSNFPRNDLVAAFLTGVPGLNSVAGGAAADMIRLNVTVPAASQTAQNHYGVIGGDNAGFPNGRRPGDDVVDIALRVVMGVLCTLNLGCNSTQAPVGAAPFTDGAPLFATDFDAIFPYLTTPIPGSFAQTDALSCPGSPTTGTPTTTNSGGCPVCATCSPNTITSAAALTSCISMLLLTFVLFLIMS